MLATGFRFRNKKYAGKKQGLFLKNGAAVLEKVISLHNGDCNPIRSYSAQQLHKATGKFQWLIHEASNYRMYKGNEEGREILVKKFKSWEGFDQLEGMATEVAMASRMSNHNNVLKLLGCCLETELPSLVYEFPTMGNLENHVFRPDDDQLTWKLKLRVATQMASAVAYLHHGLSKTIIHRDIKTKNVFLDENHSAKLFDFQFAIPIPEGETHVEVETILGTLAYLAPEVAMHGRHTEKSDVYAFGVLLCEVLIGKKGHELLLPHAEISDDNNSDSRVQSFDSFGDQSDDIPSQDEERAPPYSSDRKEAIYGKALELYCENYRQEENRAQVLEYAKLVQSCVKENPEERPNMIEVEKALRFIKTI